MDIAVRVYLKLQRSHFRAPEFDSPIKRGGDEEVGEVDGPSSAVAAQPGHWPVMTLEDLSDACLTVTHAGKQLKKPPSSCCLKLTGRGLKSTAHLFVRRIKTHLALIKPVFWKPLAANKLMRPKNSHLP